jgi:hypothetical protein
VVDQMVVSGATVSVLAVIAFDLVKSQRHIHANTKMMRRLTAAVASTRRPTSLDEALTMSTPGVGFETPGIRELELIGVTLGRTTRNAFPALKTCLESGGQVKIAIVDPYGQAPKEAARRHGVADNQGIFEHRLLATLDLLRYLGGLPIAGDRLCVRLIPFVPGIGLSATNRRSGNGVIAVDLYAHGPDANEPTLTVRRHDTHWYDHFSAEIDRIWADAQPVPMTSPHQATAA